MTTLPIDNPLFLIPVLTGLIFIIVGFIMWNFPPKRINMLYGYRTKSSMKNQEVWNFAQKFSAKEMMKLGLLLAMSEAIGLVYQPNLKIAMIIGIGLMILIVIVLLIRVELAIKNKF